MEDAILQGRSMDALPHQSLNPIKDRCSDMGNKHAIQLLHASCSIPYFCAYAPLPGMFSFRK
eukprot:1155317-Pelagomonas_calceolata.AAC.3